MKKILANKVYSDATLKKWKKEDLIEQIRILEHNWATAEEALNNSPKNSEKIISEQKAEIARLKEENEGRFHYESHLLNMNDNLNDEIAELQKQVDEQRHLVAIACDEFAKTKLKLEKSVKDTAKEILQGLNNWLRQAISNSYDKCVKGSVLYGGMNTAFHEVKELVKEVAKSKGVEVE